MGFRLEALNSRSHRASDMMVRPEAIILRDVRPPLPVVGVPFTVPSSGPDIALPRVRGPAVAPTLPLGFGRKDAAGRVGMSVGVAGYPGFSPNADPANLHIHFPGTVDVTCIGFALGRRAPAAEVDFARDATCLGDNSGPVAFQTKTGRPVGLQIGGIAGTAKYPVTMAGVLSALCALDPGNVRIGRPWAAGPSSAAGVQTGSLSFRGKFAGRDGDQAGFPDADPLLPPGPGTKWQNTSAIATHDDTGAQTTEPNCRPLSVGMCRERLLPLVHAVNIRAVQSRRPGRADDGFPDHRLPAGAQTDGMGCKPGPLDRSQIVRRKDPVRAKFARADTAARKSFYQANATPHRSAPNQKGWLPPKDHALSATRVRGQKRSVFGGPVFRGDDPACRRVLLAPGAVPKIIPVVEDATGVLWVTGPVLTAGNLIRAMTRDFVHGSRPCYQVPVGPVREVTGLAVEDLVPHHPLPTRALRRERRLAVPRSARAGRPSAVICAERQDHAGCL